MGMFSHHLPLDQTQTDLALLPQAGRQSISPIPENIDANLKVYDTFNYFVETLIQLLPATIAFIYLYDEEQEQLVLAQMSAFYPQSAGAEKLAPGKGITGQLSLTRQAVFSNGELNLERFYSPFELKHPPASTIAIPIHSESRRLLGVISVHAETPDVFTDQHRRLVAQAASVIARGLDYTRISSENGRRQRLLTAFALLSKVNNSRLPFDEILLAQAELTQKMLEVDLCVILLPDEQTGEFIVRASSRPLQNQEAYVKPLRIKPDLWSHLCSFANAAEIPRLAAHEQEQLNPLKDVPYVTLLPVPLTCSNEPLGLLTCYTSKQRDYTFEDQIVLSIITNQATLTLKQNHTQKGLEQEQLVHEFVNDLFNATPAQAEALQRRGSFFSTNLSQPHIVLQIEFAQEATNQAHDRLMEAIKWIGAELTQRYPSALQAAHANLLQVIIPLEHPEAFPVEKHETFPELKVWLNELVRHLEVEMACKMQIGISQSCTQVTDYPRAKAQASEALQLGRSLQQEHVLCFDELGGSRYMQVFSQADLSTDQYQELIQQIACHDQQKNSELLKTLDIFMRYGGNLTEASARLDIHRNTLQQRLERLQSISKENSSIDIHKAENWFPLQGAIINYRIKHSVCKK